LLAVPMGADQSGLSCMVNPMCRYSPAPPGMRTVCRSRRWSQRRRSPRGSRMKGWSVGGHCRRPGGVPERGTSWSPRCAGTACRCYRPELHFPQVVLVSHVVQEVIRGGVLLAARVVVSPKTADARTGLRNSRRCGGTRRCRSDPGPVRPSCCGSGCISGRTSRRRRGGSGRRWSRRAARPLRRSRSQDPASRAWGRSWG